MTQPAAGGMVSLNLCGSAFPTLAKDQNISTVG